MLLGRPGHRVARVAHLGITRDVVEAGALRTLCSPASSFRVVGLAHPGTTQLEVVETGASRPRAPQRPGSRVVGVAHLATMRDAAEAGAPRPKIPSVYK